MSNTLLQHFRYSVDMGRPFATHTPLGQLMVEEGWTVGDLSRACGIDTRILSDFLAGRRAIPDHYLEPLADALDVGIEDLLGEQVEQV